jgi:tetratricopeptide (TPR) repeat protein
VRQYKWSAMRPSVLLQVGWLVALAVAGCGPVVPDREARPVGTPTYATTLVPSVDLADAVERGEVSVRIRGRGRLTGSSMSLVVTMQVPRPLEVVVRAGTVLEPEQEGYTSMLVTEELRLQLLDHEARAVELVATCMSAAARPPSSDVPYVASGPVEGEVAAVVAALPVICGETIFGQEALLAAVWGLTEDVTSTQVRQRLMFGLSAIDLAKAKLILERAGVGTAGLKLFAPQNEEEMAFWHEGLGDYAFWVRGALDTAEAEYTQAIECEPSAFRYQKRAFVHREAGNYSRAIEDLDRAIEEDRQFMFYEAKAELHAELGEVEQAIENARIAVETCPYKHHVLFLLQNRAEMCLEHGRVDQAIGDYTRCIELDPDQPWRHYDRGRAYSEKGDNAAAVADYTRAIELAPEWSLAYWLRGRAHKELGDTERAISDFEQVVALGGDWADESAEELEELGRAGGA